MAHGVSFIHSTTGEGGRRERRRRGGTLNHPRSRPFPHLSSSRFESQVTGTLSLHLPLSRSRHLRLSYSFSRAGGSGHGDGAKISRTPAPPPTHPAGDNNVSQRSAAALRPSDIQGTLTCERQPPGAGPPTAAPPCPGGGRRPERSTVTHSTGSESKHRATCRLPQNPSPPKPIRHS